MCPYLTLDFTTKMKSESAIEVNSDLSCKWCLDCTSNLETRNAMNSKVNFAMDSCDAIYVSSEYGCTFFWHVSYNKILIHHLIQPQSNNVNT